MRILVVGAGIAGLAAARALTRAGQAVEVVERAAGQCSTPRGTTNASFGPRSTSPSRSRMVTDPASTRKNSSVSGWVCQTNSPSNLASLTS